MVWFIDQRHSKCTLTGHLTFSVMENSCGCTQIMHKFFITTKQMHQIRHDVNSHDLFGATWPDSDPPNVIQSLLCTK